MRKFKPEPKHPIKVHVWAGISKHGATPIVIFTGIMSADKYCMILDTALKPFLPQEIIIDFNKIMILSITSRTAKQYFEQNNINWFKTPVKPRP